MSEAESDKARKDAKRKKAKDLTIPIPQNLARRNRSLVDIEFFLMTYFADLFDEPFTDDRRDMLHSIVRAAKYGGDQAIAGPRGEGKTTLAMCGAIYLMFAGITHFPVVIGKSQTKSQAELRDMVERLQQSELLIYDFPEIGIPFQKVGAWSSNARLQTVNGKPANISIKPELIAFPRITREQINWPEHIEPVSRGQVMAAIGIDGPIRGTKHRGQRPTMAIVDDIEDREAASSDALIIKNEEIIEQDIAGMGRSSRKLPRVFLCTVQNRKCLAYKYTDPLRKPSWNGRRFRKMIRPPDRMDLVEQYIDMRKARTADDPDARVAFAFWKLNRDAIESGCIVSNQRSYNGDLHADGDSIELSACMSYYNRVADVGAKAVATEIDNDPPETVGPQGQGLTAEIVASRLSGLSKRMLPANTVALTAAIDLGKYRCHWVVTAWWLGGGGCVVDYGVAEVTGTDRTIDNEASQPMIYRALLNWRDEVINKQYIDTTGTNRKIAFCLVDSGTFTDAAYAFCKEVKGIFQPSKGLNPYYRRKQSSDSVIASDNLHAQKLTAQGTWLYELDTNYWKQWVHERFLTPTFDEDNMLRRGSLSLYSLEGTQKHGSFSQHIAAEELLSEFKEGKGVKTYWNVKNENNHWFDATYMAAAGSEVCGVKLYGEAEIAVEPKHVDVDRAKPRKQPSDKPHGRFRSRPGGWVPKRR